MINPSLDESNILIVDDQQANIDVLEGFLEMQGYLNIRTTTNPRQVLSLVESFQPDIILLDLSMPYLTGFEVMELLKDTVPGEMFLPILVLTADITTESKIRALSDGANDFLTKPFDLLEVGLRIKNLLFSSYLQQQLRDQNKILEEKVRERTRELVQKNAELNVALQRAESSDRLKTSFINNISHEIRTPLNGILGFGQILTEVDLSEEEKSEYLHILNASSERLINTVTNFMEISLITSGNQDVNKIHFSPEYVLDDIAKHFKKSFESKQLILEVVLPPAGKRSKVYTDKELLFKILRNLVDNAIKFTKVGKVTLGYEIQDNHFVFSVQDTGKGISEEGKETIFKNFMQEDNSYTRGYEGCGLGLSISTGLIELLGGKIWVDSEKGKGSTFYFSIPDEKAGLEMDGAEARKRGRDEVKTILVAEDDEVNFVYINILLKHRLIRVLHAPNGLEAVKMVKAKPEIDALLVDLKMPVMDGLEATRQVKEFRPDLPVLAVTAYSGGEDRVRAQEAGCDEFITKPIKKELLFEKLARQGVVVAD